MNHIVPNWDLHDPSVPARFDIYPQHTSSNTPTTMIGYEMEELTWENGQLLTHGLGFGLGSRAAVETLEAIVDEATQKKQAVPPPGTGTHIFNSVDALVPCGGAHNDVDHQGNDDDDQAVHVPPRSTCVEVYDTRVDESAIVKKARLETRVPVDGEWSFQRSQPSGSATRSRSGGDSISRHVRSADTCEKESTGFGLPTASFCSQDRSLSSSDKPASTNYTTTVDSSVCLTRQQESGCDEEEKKKGSAKSSSSTKRSRVAANHNQSERKRRETINQKIKTLQKMVPNPSKTDKASMLDEVIDHMKSLQAQLHMMTMSRMNIPSMMPFSMPHHSLHMPMPIMSPMGMGMTGMDMNIINPIMARQNLANLTPNVVNPNTTFMPMAPPVTMTPADPSTYLTHLQSQPMTMEAYSQMVAQIQLQQQKQMASITKT